MTKENRDKWLSAQADQVKAKFQLKYINGAIEHRCDLGEVEFKTLLVEAECEALDMLAYLAEMRRRLVVEQIQLNGCHQVHSDLVKLLGLLASDPGCRFSNKENSAFQKELVNTYIL